MNWNDPLVIIVGVAALAIVAIVGLSVAASTPTFREMLVGVATDPRVVGLVRALLIYVIPLALTAAAAYVQGWNDPRLLPLVPIALGALRVAESYFDAWKKPLQNAPNPPPIAGSGHGNPAA